ncbi:MAG: hypothetical protein PHO01_03285 [Desulfotomaculaceae bacterium]|nr:hypothetical protein [Desulfotomaculaceae bacterium]
MNKLLSALKKNRTKFLGLKNVVGIGVGYKQAGENDTGQPAFIVYVEKKLPRTDLSRSHIVPRKVDGLETDVVEIGVVKMLGVRTARERPCQPGMSIGHYQATAGTIGAVVRDRETGELMILSNNHVLANGSSIQEARAKTGDPVLQPGACDTSWKQNIPQVKWPRRRIFLLMNLFSDKVCWNKFLWGCFFE